MTYGFETTTDDVHRGRRPDRQDRGRHRRVGRDRRRDRACARGGGRARRARGAQRRAHGSRRPSRSASASPAPRSKSAPSTSRRSTACGRSRTGTSSGTTSCSCSSTTRASCTRRSSAPPKASRCSSAPTTSATSCSRACSSPRSSPARPSRVVNLSSGGHFGSDIVWDDPNFEQREYDKFAAYGQSKTANILFSVELEHRLGDRGVHAYAVHPGMISTELGRYMTRDDMAALQERAKRGPSGGMPPRKSIEQGAATTRLRGHRGRSRRTGRHLPRRLPGDRPTRAVGARPRIGGTALDTVRRTRGRVPYVPAHVERCCSAPTHPATDTGNVRD